MPFSRCDLAPLVVAGEPFLGYTCGVIWGSGSGERHVGFLTAIMNVN